MNGLAVLAPWAIALGVAAAGALAVLHAITVGRPRPAWLPTARFAPDRAPRAERRLARPADRVLLALRVIAALLAAAGLAHPVREPARRPVARVVLADLSDAAARPAVRDSVQALVGAGDALIAFAATTGPAIITPPRPHSTAADAASWRSAIDSALATVPEGRAEARPSLSAALIAARRTAPALAAAADSLELVIVSPLARDAVDPATLPIRATWAGRARIVAVRSAQPGTLRPPFGDATATRRTVSLRGGPADDALAASAALAGLAQSDAAPIRVLRAAPTAADLAWAADRRHVLVLWPAAGSSTRGAQAVVVGEQAAVAAFGRAPVPGGRTANDQTAHPTLRVIARWADGAPAAVEERGATNGCVRTVGLRVSQAGDAALRPDFVSLLPTLLGPCVASRDSAPLAPADLARLATSGPLLAAAPLRPSSSAHDRDPLGATLLALSALVLLAELPLRRVLRHSAASDQLAPGNESESPDSATRVAA